MSETPPSIKDMSDKASMLLTGRQYAAIHLCVPDSGEKWLDDMIKKALRDRFACHYVAHVVTLGLADDESSVSWIGENAYFLADEMMRMRQEGQP
jgi:hypothetical protein